MSEQHIVVQRSHSAYEVWAPCSDEGCLTRHRMVCTSPSRFDAEKVARSLDAPAASVPSGESTP